MASGPILRRVLVIDDERETLAGFGAVLRDAGFDAFLASSAEEGFAVLRDRRPACVLADFRLPDYSGLDLLRRARREGFTEPFVIITGFATTRLTVAAMKLGAANVLEKPVFPEDLLGALAESLQSHRTVEAHTRHALTRWSHLVASMIASPQDPKTILRWARLIAASPGAVRNCCRMAGISPRRSLVFGRLLRACQLCSRTGDSLSDVLDISDRRTLISLLQFAGFGADMTLPPDAGAFLASQKLVTSELALEAVRTALSTI